MNSCLIPVVGLNDARFFVTRPPRLKMCQAKLHNLRPLCQAPYAADAHTSAPAPVRIGLVNAKLLVNKSFILKELFTSWNLDLSLGTNKIYIQKRALLELRSLGFPKRGP